MNQNRPRLLLPLIAGAVAAAPGLAQVALMPPGFEAIEAPSSHDYPFGNNQMLSQFGWRAQLIYDASYFTSQGWRGAQPITRLRWRSDGTNGGGTGGTYSGVSIALSTAAFDHAAVQRTFDANHGADRTTVFAGNVAVAPTAPTPPGQPNVFFVDITLTTPFLYDPAAGDLVIDVGIANITGGDGGRSDAETRSGTRATLLYNRFSAQATTAEARLLEVAQVVEVGFVGPIQASTAPFGTGCGPLGAAPLALQAANRPVTGTTFAVAVQDVPAGTPVGWFVLSLGGVAAGADLGPLGAPGCRRYVDLQGAAAQSFQPLGALGTTAIAIPGVGSLAGTSFFVQAAVAAPTTNALGLLVSDGLDATIGTL